jgi:hypothetical protein
METYANAVVEGNTSESERLEQLGRYGTVRLWVCSGSCRWILLWREVGDALGGLVLNIRNIVTGRHDD